MCKGGSIYHTTIGGIKMQVRKNIARWVAGVAVAAMTLTVTTSPAEARDGNGTGRDCPGGWFCLYADRGFRGRMLKFQQGGDLGIYNFRDDAESYVNNTRFSVTLTDYHTFRPDQTKRISPNDRSRDMGSWRNRVDKVKVNR